MTPPNGRIPFNKPYITGTEFEYIQDAISRNKLSGNGYYATQCQDWMVQHIGCQSSLLTHSCTAALEMSALLIDLQPGDEVIMPSYTFVSTANAFVLRGAVPVFVDIRKDTLNIDETLIEAAITPKTKAIVVVHYAGVACEMTVIQAIAKQHTLFLIEDAAQAINAHYHGQPLGTFGEMATLSFHETKNIISGEGGALLINDEKFIEPAEIILEKGTNRKQFFQGMVDKYTWVDIGSSYLPSEIIGAFLFSQLKHADDIIRQRLAAWNLYNSLLRPMADKYGFQCPTIPEHVQHNGHIYYLIMPSKTIRDNVITYLENNNINAVFHYIPLHNSPAGIKYGRAHGKLPTTIAVSERIIRLPMWIGIESHIEFICEQVLNAAEKFSVCREIMDNNACNLQ